VRLRIDVVENVQGYKEYKERVKAYKNRDFSADTEERCITMT
jgi:hypothetical protein